MQQSSFINGEEVSLMAPRHQKSKQFGSQLVAPNPRVA
jgi:hypothetical protein